jgi:small-conductance mechanosensitive channel
VQEFLQGLWSQLAGLTPKLAGALIVLVIGYVAGRLIGRGLSKVLDKIGLDDLLRKTAIGKALDKTKMTIVGFFDALIRWFVYLVAILAAVNILEIEILSSFIRQVVEYIPSLAAGILVILVGFILADFVGDALRSVGKAGAMEYSGIFADGLKFLLYFVVVVMGLSLMRIDVAILHVFATALAWGAAAGIGVGLGIAFGWGFKDAVSKRAEGWLTTLSESAKRPEQKTG